MALPFHAASAEVTRQLPAAQDGAGAGPGRPGEDSREARLGRDSRGAHRRPCQHGSSGVVRLHLRQLWPQGRGPEGQTGALLAFSGPSLSSVNQVMRQPGLSLGPSSRPPFTETPALPPTSPFSAAAPRRTSRPSVRGVLHGPALGAPAHHLPLALRVSQMQTVEAQRCGLRSRRADSPPRPTAAPAEETEHTPRGREV